MKLINYIVSLILIASIHLYAQNISIPWSSVNMGFSESKNFSTTVTSVIGQSFVGNAQDGQSSVISGFLADSMFIGPPEEPYTGPVYSFQRWVGTGSVDGGYSVTQARDSGYVVCGTTTSNNYRMYIIKYNQRGDTMWSKMIVSPRQGGTGGQWIDTTSDGGYIVTGWGSVPSTVITGLYLVKLNADGDTLWTKWYEGSPSSGYLTGTSVQQTVDGGYIVSGYSSGFNPAQAYILKTDANGNQEWANRFSSFGYEYPLSIQQLPDSGYIVGGWGQSPFSILMYAIRLNTDGSIKWRKTYSIDGAICCSRGNDIRYTDDGGYILVGSTSPNYSGGENIYLVKLNADGDTMWTKTYGGPNSDYGTSVRQTRDGGYIITGTGNYVVNQGLGEVLLLKVNAIGDSLWQVNIGGSNNDYGYAVRQTIDRGYIIAGQTTSFGDYTDVYVIKTDRFGIITAVRDEQQFQLPSGFHLHQNYPNPFNPTTKIMYELPQRSNVMLRIYNILGQEIATLVDEMQDAGVKTVVWSALSVPSGIYFYRFTAGSYSEVKKLLLLK